MKKYCLNNLSEKQINILIEALDLYSRIGIGQFYTISQPGKFPAEYCWEHHKDEYQDRLTQADFHLKQAAHILMDCPKDGYGSHGIFSSKVNELCRIAFDMQQVIKDKTLDDTNKSIRKDILKTSDKEELISVEIFDKQE